MLVYNLKCIRCNNEQVYHTHIQQEDLTLDACLCGGKRQIAKVSEIGILTDRSSYDALLTVDGA